MSFLGKFQNIANQVVRKIKTQNNETISCLKGLIKKHIYITEKQMTVW